MIKFILMIWIFTFFGACSNKEINTNFNDGKLIDVRTADEFAAGHLYGAFNLDLLNGNFERALSSLDKSEKYYLYCRSGNRSAQAKKLMERNGFENVVNAGAYSALVQNGAATAK